MSAGTDHDPRENPGAHNGAEEDYYPDPEDFRVEPKPPPGPLAHFPSLRHAVPAMFFFIIFYLATVVYGRYPEGDYLWLSGDALLNRHEYWRIITSLLAHSDLYHLLSNAMIFLVFGWMLKAYFGLIAFPVLSFMTGIIANSLTAAVYRPETRLIGASGMAYGMAALWLVFYIRHDTDHSVPVRIFRAIGFSLVMLFPTTFDPQISYLAHGIGFAAGLVIGILSLHFISAHNPK
jgi:rhomboid protease GluP